MPQAERHIERSASARRTDSRLNIGLQSLNEMHARLKPGPSPRADSTASTPKILQISREIHQKLTRVGYSFGAIRACGTPLAFSPCQSQRATARPIGANAVRARTKEFIIMLVLSRKVGERIHVGDNIVLEIRRI